MANPIDSGSLTRLRSLAVFIQALWGDERRG